MTSSVTPEHVEACRYNVPGPFIAPEGTPSPQVVYRAYGHDGDLLYVGRSIQPRGRLASHASTKVWWHLVSFLTLEQFDSFAECQTAERNAIATERPRYNVVDSATRTIPSRYTKEHFRPRTWEQVCDRVENAQLDRLLAMLPVPASDVLTA